MKEIFQGALQTEVLAIIRKPCHGVEFSCVETALQLLQGVKLP